MIRLISFVFILLFIAACGNKYTCKNTDTVFKDYGPTDQPYKEELLKQLQHTDTARIHYMVDKYVEFNGKPFISLRIIADSFCAQIFVDLKNPNKLNHFKVVKGISYTGAELKGLQFKTDTINGQYNFVFEEGTINGKKN